MRKPLEFSLAAAATAATLGLGAAPALAGTWTAMPMDSVTGLPHRNVVLLTDGTVMAQEENGDGHVWTRLTPDATGSYLNGTWSSAGATQVDRRYYPMAVLRDGRFFIAGGEDVGAGESENVVELYDPVSNHWNLGAAGLFGDIGDDASQVLADGRVFLGYRFGAETQVYDPTTDKWTQTADAGSGSTDEHTWSLLPNGTVLDFTPVQPLRYLPSSNQWVNDAVPPLTMQNSADGEIGPGVFLYNGTLLAFSAFGRAAIYTPGASPTANGTWVTGPTTPPPAQPNGNPFNAQYTEDGPACIEVNGKVLIVTTDTPLGAARFAEYDPASNTIAQIPNPPGLDPTRSGYLIQMLALPSGQLLVTGTNINDFLYTPSSGPQSQWQPTIQSITANSNGTYTLSGRQLNGLSQGDSYGDEGQGQTNFPLVRLTSGSTVRYARTFNHSTMAFATGSATVQTTFTLPPGIPAGTYQVAAVANGIASPSFSLTLATAQLGASVTLTDMWESGYCATINVTNTGSQTITSWKVVMDIGAATQNAQWNAAFAQTGSTLTATNMSQNGTLAPGAQTSFGFCTQMPPAVRGPIVDSATGA